MKVSESTNVQMPLKTVVSLITLVAVGTWAYFGIVERLNNIVLDYTVPKVYGEAIGYLKYLEDASRLAVPIELPVQPDRVFKQLEMQPYM